MKKFFTWLLASFSLLMLLPACDEVLELSDKGAIVRFRVNEHSPTEIQIGEGYMDGDSLIVPLMYGRYNFPLLLRTSIDCSPGIRIRNIEPDSVVFDHPEEVIIFYLQTESGLPLKRFLKIKELPRSNKAGVVKFKPESYSSDFTTLLSDSAIIADDSEGKRITLFMPEGGYPIYISPYVQLTDTATLYQYDPSVPMTFRRESDVVPMQVRAASGSISTWNVTLRRGYEPSAQDFVPQPVYNAINLKAEELTSVADANHQVTATTIDPIGKTITLTVKNIRPGERGSAIKFPLTCSLQFPQSEPRMTVGYRVGEPLSFSTINSSSFFYLIHTQEVYKQRWRVKLQGWLSNDNLVSGFNITKSIPASIELGEAVSINGETGAIVIPVEEGRQYFPLTVNASITIPPTATFKGVTAKQTFVFADLTKKATFKVVAEDGVEKEYTVSLRFAGDKNTEADIESFRITEVSSTDNRVKINNIPIINKEHNTVEIEVLDWVRYLPLRVKATVTATDRVDWLTAAPLPTEWLTFDNIEAIHTYELRSEDGLKTNTWTVKLKNSEKPKSNEADLKEFILSGLSGGSTLDKIVIDGTNHIVKVLFNNVGEGLSFVPGIKTSDKATLIGISDGVRISFTELKAQSFIIRSESEEVSTTWSLLPIYAPQLTNGSLDNWSGGNPVGWATANNSFVTGTTSGAGLQGLAAQLNSKEADVLGIKEMAAGSLFLGNFSFSIGLKDTPKKMTYFGIPFSARPEAVAVDLNYVSSEVKGKSGMIGIPDKASVAIMLLRWRGTGNIVFHDDDENADKIDKIGIIRGEIDATGGWKNFNFKVDYDPAFHGVTPTHIHVVFSSSYRGDAFETGVSSKLLVDNVKLIY